MTRVSRRAALMLLLFLAAPFASGCLTVATWGLAVSGNEMTPLSVAGVAPAATPGEPPLLIVRYFNPDGGPYKITVSYAVPLTEDGRPAYPFGHTGDARDIALIVAEMPPEQLRAVRTAALPRVGRDEAKRRTTRHGRRWEAVWSSHDLSPDIRVAAMIYRLTPPPHNESPPPRPATLPADEAEANAQLLARAEASRHARLKLKPGEYVVFLPPRQPRPRGQTAWALTQAALWTPFTLGLDAILSPFEVVGTVAILLSQRD